MIVRLNNNLFYLQYSNSIPIVLYCLKLGKEMQKQIVSFYSKTNPAVKALILNRLTWVFQNKIMTSQQIPWHFIQTCRMEILNLISQGKNVHMKISHINFPNLRHLTLCNQFIEDLTPLTLLEAPCLSSLDLKNNQIVSVRCFRKNFYFKLEQITLYNNWISEYQHLNECSWQDLRKIFLNRTSKVNLLNSAWICKLPSQNLQQYQLAAVSGQSEKQRWQTIMKKYQFVQQDQE